MFARTVHYFTCPEYSRQQLKVIWMSRVHRSINKNPDSSKLKNSIFLRFSVDSCLEMTKSRFLWKLTRLWRIAYCSRPWSSRLVNPHCLEVICNACMAFRKDMFIVLIKMWSKRTAGKEDRPKSQSQSPWRKMITVILLKSRVWDYQEASWLYRQEASQFLLRADAYVFLPTVFLCLYPMLPYSRS